MSTLEGVSAEPVQRVAAFPVSVAGDGYEGRFRFVPVSSDNRCEIAVEAGAGFLAFTLEQLLSRPVGRAFVASTDPSSMSHWELNHFGPEKSRRYRLPDLRFTSPRVPASVMEAPEVPAATETLVIHDESRGWRDQDASSPLVGHLEDFLRRGRRRDSGTSPRVIVNISELPKVDPDNDDMPFVSPVWRLLDAPEVRDDVCVVCSATTPRLAGAAVSRRISWEQAVEDLASELGLFEPLRALARFGRLIVRFGHVGAVLVHTQCRRREAHLVFSPTAKNGIFRDPEEEGRVIGKNTMVIAAILHELYLRNPGPHDLPIDLYTRAIANGLRAGMRLFKSGFPAPTTSSGAEFLRAFLEPARKVIAEAQPQEGEEVFVPIQIPSRVLSNPRSKRDSTSSDWEILRDQITRHHVEPEAPNEPKRTSRVNIGMAIVMFGHAKVLNRALPPTRVPDGPPTVDDEVCRVLSIPDCRVTAEEPADYVTLSPGRLPLLPVPGLGAMRPAAIARYAQPVYVPLGRFGMLVTAERRELECFRSVRNLLLAFRDSVLAYRGASSHAGRAPVLSLAVFGPPGSGKSFAIKQIIESVVEPGGDCPLEIIERNLALLDGPRELASVFSLGRKLSGNLKKPRIPVFFFDEFDRALENERLGWLQHFLSPMEDGTYRGAGAGEPELIGPAAFVFAGGIAHSYAQFDPSEPDPFRDVLPDHSEHARRLEEFASRKGPDFVSRLRGHLNILPIEVETGRTKPIIRRAMVLRGMLASMPHRTDAEGVALIDPDVVYAMLTVDRYRHGTRSMKAILEMCRPLGRRICKTSLPTPSQLNMHVNAEEFMIRMHRGRFREQRARINAPSAPSIGALPNHDVGELS